MVVETTVKDILDLLNVGITISGVDLDIRDLSSAQDNVEVKQATAANLKAEVHTAAGTVLPTGIYGFDGSLWETLNTDTNNRLLVSATATNLDIRDLTSASDSVEVKQGTPANLKGIAYCAVEDSTVYIPKSEHSGVLLDPWKYLADNGVFIAASGTASNTTTTLYTVPSGKVAYITSISINSIDLGTDPGALSNAIIATKNVIQIGAPGVEATTSEAIGLNFFPPIKIVYNQTVQIKSDSTNVVCEGAFTGYEIST